VAAAAIAAGALVGSAAVSASAAEPRFERTHVAISRVQSDAPGFDDRSSRSLNAEWVEITNSASRGVNLNGWTLSDRDGNRYTFDHYRLAGRSTVRIHTGYGRDTSRDLYQDRRNEVWDNHSDVATLRTDRGRFVDSVSWGRHHDRDHGRDDHRGQGDHRDHRRDDHRRDDHRRDDHRGQGDHRDHRRDDHRGQGDHRDHGRDDHRGQGDNRGHGDDRGQGRDHDRGQGENRGQGQGRGQGENRGQGETRGQGQGQSQSQGHGPLHGLIGH
jgi:hypothetical protein